MPDAAVAQGMTHPASPDPVAGDTAFAVRVEGFEGPFDLLLSLIAKHRLEVTALALHSVTDDFVAHLKRQGDQWDLNETTQFLVVAAILLDLKAARLLPGDEEEDAEDLALLDARDLLFARLLQYRAFKEASAFFALRLYDAPPRVPRQVGLDPGLSSLLPEVQIQGSPDDFAAVAIRALSVKPEPEVSVDHIHTPTVSVRDQAAMIVSRLRRSGRVSFRSLISDCPDVPHIVARFLALLELYRESAVTFDQAGPLGDLLIRWIGAESGDVDVEDEFDDGSDDQRSTAPDDPAEESHV